MQDWELKKLIDLMGVKKHLLEILENAEERLIIHESWAKVDETYMLMIKESMKRNMVYCRIN